MNKKYDVIGIENLCADYAVKVDHLPKSDGDCQLFDELWQSGGNASNAIVALVRQGANCAMLGTIGDDEYGKFCVNDMASYGVDVSHIFTQGEHTSYCICVAETETGHRSFIGRMKEDDNLSDEQIDEEFIASSKYLHISSVFSSAKQKAVEYAHKHGVIVSVDADEFETEGNYYLDNCDVIVMSERFYQHYFKNDDYIENLKSLINKGTKVAVVTLGKDGCAGVNDKGESAIVPAFSGYKIVDTTAAGDVFHGGFLYGLLQGWNLKDTMRYASAISYINCTSLGGRVGIPDKKAVEKFLNEGIIDHSERDIRMKHYRSIMSFKTK